MAGKTCAAAVAENTPALSVAASSEPAPSGWSARLDLGFQVGQGRTVLAHRERRGPLAVQRPFYPEGEVCHVYLLHPPGGVVGGDQLHTEVELAPNSRALLTAPGATKFYRSAGAVASQEQRFNVGDGASLEWLPHENILFPGARVRSQTRVELQGDAHLALWEIHCLGRPVIGEVFSEGSLQTGLQLWRDGRPLLLERLRVDAQQRQCGSILAGRAVTATALFSHSGEAELTVARDCIAEAGPGLAAATLVDDLLLLRYLGDSTEKARALFTQTWAALRPRLFGRPAVAPRIWST